MLISSGIKSEDIIAIFADRSAATIRTTFQFQAAGIFCKAERSPLMHPHLIYSVHFSTEQHFLSDQEILLSTEKLKDTIADNHKDMMFLTTPLFLRDELKTKLPSYMIPVDIIPIEKMPLKLNGKVDSEAIRKQDVCTGSLLK